MLFVSWKSELDSLELKKVTKKFPFVCLSVRLAVCLSVRLVREYFLKSLRAKQNMMSSLHSGIEIQSQILILILIRILSLTKTLQSDTKFSGSL